VTQFGTYTGAERKALKAHGLETHRPSQLADAFVLGMRHAATVAAEMDCAHRCGVGMEVAAAIRNGVPSGVKEGGK
jgi:hypothetical protein